MLSLLRLVLDTTDKAIIALPVSSSRVAERMCEVSGATLVWTKLSTPHLMEVASTPGIDFAASQEGGYIFPAFLPAYDGVATFVKTLGLLAASDQRLSDVVSDLPRIHIAHESVVTPWEKKGAVMRTIVEKTKDHEHVLVDGVKVLYDDGWVLVLPDPEEPITHIWAESRSDADARVLAKEYVRRIRQMLR
jgi:mannose-1-phosphate guanylyltransferase/phosphomannomutase